jgi:uncharacterized protein (UPF0333 family)
MEILYPHSEKAQTTIEYLLIISVVVLLLIGLFLTLRELRASTEGNVTIDNKSESPVNAIKGQLEELRNSTNQSANQT